MKIRLPFKWDPAIGLVVTVSFPSAVKVIPAIQDPVNQKEQFNLLVKMNFLVVNNLIAVASRPAYPYKYEP